MRMKVRDVFILVLPLMLLESCSLNNTSAYSGDTRDAARRAINQVNSKDRASQSKTRFLSSRNKQQKSDSFNLFSRKGKKKLGNNTPRLFINQHPHPHAKTEVVDDSPRVQPRQSRSRVRYMKGDLDSGMANGLKPASSSHHSHSHGGSSHSHGGTTHTHGSSATTSPQSTSRQRSRQTVTIPRPSSPVTQPRVSNTSRSSLPSLPTGQSGGPSVKVLDQTPALSIEEINRLIDANSF